MGKKILIVSNNNEITLKIKAVSEFLGKDVAITEDVESAKSIALEDHSIGLCLISHSESKTEEEFVTFFQSYYSRIPVYLVRTDHSPCIDYSINGIETLRFPTDHNRILQVMGMAEVGVSSQAMPAETRVKLTGASPEISRVRELVNHVSNTDANVLLLGESGTGKEVVARSVHALSSRSTKPFIAVNCAAIPADLLESELFGYEKGAFTGATTTRRGRFELAEGGTLFLDEIGDMPLPMQVKLLRVIQERCFERVGGTKSMNCDVRLIAATHQNLERCIEQGKFRMDLFYRLNVFPIDIPPLRKRIGDIPQLLGEFADKAQLDLGHREAIQFDEQVTMALCDHPLPGNVRELQNLVERLAILYPEELITLDKLPERYQGIHSIPDTNFEPIPAAVTDSKMESELLSGKFDLKDYLTTLEKNLIYQALNNTNWVVTQAAESLCLRRTTLIQKIRRLNIQNKDKQNLSLGM